MIFVDQTFGLASAQLRVRAGVSRGSGLYYAHLRGIRWDGSLMPRGRHPRQDWSVILFVARGQISAAPKGPDFETDSVVLVRHGHIFPTEADPNRLRAKAWDTEGIALRVPTKHVLRASAEPCRVEISETLTAALRASTARLRDETCTEQTVRRQLSHLLRLCVTEGLVSPAAYAEYVADEEGTPKRAQEALFPTVENLSEQPMLVDVTERVDVTDRQARRDVIKMQQDFDLFDRGFRETVHRWRLTAAVLLLSARDISATEVASAVGYGSLTPMGRAFKKAKLPTPTRVRRQLQAAPNSDQC